VAGSDDVTKLHAELEEEERAVSLRRRRLHERIAFYPDMASEDLHRQERELAAMRRELYARIDARRGPQQLITGDEAA
jgi:hypothetical protein